MYGMRLRTAGETQMKNIEDLIETLPPLSKNCDTVPITYNRGYCKMIFLEMIDKKGFITKTIAAPLEVLDIHSYLEMILITILSVISKTIWIHH